MFNLATVRRPWTASFHTAVRTVLRFHWIDSRASTFPTTELSDLLIAPIALFRPNERNPRSYVSPFLVDPSGRSDLCRGTKSPTNWSSGGSCQIPGNTGGRVFTASLAMSAAVELPRVVVWHLRKQGLNAVRWKCRRMWAPRDDRVQLVPWRAGRNVGTCSIQYADTPLCLRLLRSSERPVTR
jgi:hypothetical protein